MTFIAPSTVLRLSLETVDLVENIVRLGRNVALVPAGDRGGERAEDGGDDRVVGEKHRRRGIGEQRIAGADGIDDVVGKAVDGEEGADVLVALRLAAERHQ